MWVLVQVLTLLVVTHDYLLLVVRADGGCVYQKHEVKPDVYYINMDKSKDRKEATEKHLSEMGYNYHRVRGITPQELFIPDDLMKTWDNRWCMVDSEIPLPDHLNISSSKFTGMNLEAKSKYTAIITGMCGRKRSEAKNTGNLLKELGCTSSHLEAMRRAVYSNTSNSRYAIIMEDDVFFPFDVDWDALARTAPAGFGILQLFNSNGNSMAATWQHYVKDPSAIWIQRHPMKFFDYWSTCAYLIDRLTMKEIVDSVAYHRDGWLNFKIIAGINNPCVPASCCPVGNDQFEAVPPCVWAPRGFQADSFLYAMAKTYMLTVPLITNGAGTDKSTFHQSHVSLLHSQAFSQQRGFINQMLKGEVAMPPHVKKDGCKELPVDLMKK
jgi:GR25 family glycosyltransferase involved in LPS biosynthesis